MLHPGISVKAMLLAIVVAAAMAFVDKSFFGGELFSGNNVYLFGFLGLIYPILHAFDKQKKH
ncbi:MAG: hypothetical protein KAR62_03690 [Sphingomonadales bacterium]|nr:hypothetical protein [Sphingomonadales bacterium]